MPEHAKDEHLPSDDALIQEAQNGSEQAFNKLVERHQEKVCRIAYRIIGNGEESRDIAQEVFIRAYEIIPKWRFKAMFFTWLYRTTMNMALSAQRKRNKLIYFNDFHEKIAPLAEESTDANLLNSETKQGLEKIMQKLTKRQQQVIILRIYERFSISHTAYIMKCREGTVKALLNQSLKKMSFWIKKEESHGTMQTQSG